MGSMMIYVVSILGAMSPGPDFFIVVKNSLQHPFRVALCTVGGIALGCVVHVSFAVFGVVLFASYLGQFFTTLQLVGGLYLGYLGIMAVKIPLATAQAEIKAAAGDAANTPTARERNQQDQSQRWQAFKEGLFCNILNAKASIFYISLFSQVNVPIENMLLRISYSIGLPATVGLWFGLLTWMLTMQAIKARLVRYQVLASRLMGVLLIGIAVWVLATGMSPYIAGWLAAG